MTEKENSLGAGGRRQQRAYSQRAAVAYEGNMIHQGGDNDVGASYHRDLSVLDARCQHEPSLHFSPQPFFLRRHDCRRISFLNQTMRSRPVGGANHRDLSSEFSLLTSSSCPPLLAPL